MRIDPKGMIAHHPALVVRDCLRKLKVHTEWDLRVLQKAASVDLGRGRALARALSSEGLIKRVRPDIWTITQTGQRLSSATAAKPVSRVTAERVLCEFLESGAPGQRHGSIRVRNFFPSVSDTETSFQQRK